MSEAGNLTPQQKTLARIADKNVKILPRLINQVLDFRKYENGKLDLNLVEVDIRHLVEDWTDAHVAMDVEKIERVFFNLVSNAFKYTPDNGEIGINLSFTHTDMILSVSDTGRGISAEDLGNIFDRFFQVDKVHPNGSGIGLSLAKAFVELHGGSITAVSEPGEGSVFTVSLPLRHVADKAEAFSLS